MKSNTILNRATFKTSREMDFFSEKELTTQTGHAIDEWPLVFLKETIDNALDACEQADTAPRIDVVASADGMTVSDNGPGIPAETIDGAMDFTVRVSNREMYVAPDRGAQGNALMTLLAIPYVLDPEAGRLSITANGTQHNIVCRADPISQRVIIEDETSDSNGRPGTTIGIQWTRQTDEDGEMVWPFGDSCRPADKSERPWIFDQRIRERALDLLAGYALFNPHLTLSINWLGDRKTFEPTNPEWRKWAPNKPTSPHWYETRHLERLIGAYITLDRDQGTGRTVSAFLTEFDGLAGSAKRKIILEETALARVNLSALADTDGLDTGRIAKLLDAMKQHTKPVKAPRLGIIGKDHFTARLVELGCKPESIEYAKKARVDDGIPFVLESAFGWFGEEGRKRRCIFAGANWSPGIANPFRRFRGAGDGLEATLEEMRAGAHEPIVFALHLAHPRVEYTDRGKTAIVLTNDSAVIQSVTRSVTKKWTDQRKKEERNRRDRRSRNEYIKKRKMPLTEAAELVIPAAYAKASTDGTLPAHARQVFYAARKRMQEMTGKELRSVYFTQHLLPDYQREHGCDNWRIVYDARGHLSEPHTAATVALGTLEVDKYLAEIRYHQPDSPSGVTLKTDYPTKGPRHRFSAILFIEKEGFNPLFEEVKLAERYDLAIMSTKGQSVTAARRLVDTLCSAADGVPVLILHDFDAYGLKIQQTLVEVSKAAAEGGRVRYEFDNEINFVDFGLRLDDVKACGLESEAVGCKTLPSDLPATDAEKEFLLGGQRVELNAFTSGDFIEWIESKLEEHGITKVIPDNGTVKQAYRRAYQITAMNRQLGMITRGAAEAARSAKIPRGLRKKIEAAIKEDPARPWDAILSEIANERLEDSASIF